jgi:hypothetical protein
MDVHNCRDMQVIGNQRDGMTRDKELGKSEKREGRESGVFHGPGGHFTFGILLENLWNAPVSLNRRSSLRIEFTTYFARPRRQSIVR